MLKQMLAYLCSLIIHVYPWSQCAEGTWDTHRRCMIWALYELFKFSMTLNIILANWEQNMALHMHTHTHKTTKEIWITNELKMMMTNDYVLQGQKYTNGVGAMPPRMMGSSSDILYVPCRWQITICHLCPAGAYKSKLFCHCLAETWLSGLSAFVLSEGMLHTRELDSKQIIMSGHYEAVLCGNESMHVMLEYLCYYNSII